MKKLVILLFNLSLAYSITAQETTKQKEIGLVFNNFDNFGLTFKTGNNKSLWRFNSLFFDGSNLRKVADSLTNENNNNGVEVKIGKEYRKIIDNKLELRFGADFSFAYSYEKTNYDDKTVNNYDRFYEQNLYSPGINLVFGLNYTLSKNFIIGAELLPYLSYTIGKSTNKNNYLNNYDEKSDISEFNYGISNNSVLLSIVYRF